MIIPVSCLCRTYAFYYLFKNVDHDVSSTKLHKHIIKARNYYHSQFNTADEDICCNGFVSEASKYTIEVLKC